jgi:ABC-type spermidine/putrescine transport system permease subunit II
MSSLFTDESHIDRETVLDILVNIIPMVILGFFLVMFLINSPWGYDVGISTVAHLLTLIPFVLLGILTYLSARVISRDEQAMSDSEE